MDKGDERGLGWTEESVTDVSYAEGLPEVKVVPFSKHEEGGGIGADYLWWWLDSEGPECFGMLVQAKRLKRVNRSWSVDIQQGKGRQFRDLIASAEDLGVPAIYGVYTGGRVVRKALPCYHASQPDCLDCCRMAISLISAYQMTLERSAAANAKAVFSESIPLENLADPDRPAGEVWDLNLRDIPSGPLRNFLLSDQSGPREIAKKIFKLISDRRRRLFTAASPEIVASRGAAVFPATPVDPSHFPGPYYGHVLQGLRQRRPEYLDELLSQPSLRSPGLPEDALGYRVPYVPSRPRALEGLGVDGVIIVSVGLLGEVPTGALAQRSLA